MEGIGVNAGVIFRGVDFDDEEYGFVEEGKDPRKVGYFFNFNFWNCRKWGWRAVLLTNTMAGTK